VGIKALLIDEQHAKWVAHEETKLGVITGQCGLAEPTFN
jgi:hypothetical protein